MAPEAIPAKTLSLAKRELLNTLSNRRYMVGFFIQLLLLLTIVPSLSTVLEEGSLSLPAPTMRGYIPLGLVDHSREGTITREELLRNPKLEVRSFPSQREALRELDRGSLAAVVVLPDGYDEGSLEPLYLKVWTSAKSLKRESALSALDESLAVASSRIAGDRQALLGMESHNPIYLQRHFLRPVVIEKGGARFSSFFLGYLIPLILFFPIFMSGGIVVDSMVGERERGTLEPLLAAPLPRLGIVTGKFLGIFAFIGLQCLLWLTILALRGVPVSNFWEVLILLLAVNGGVISLALLLSVYSSSTKGANISLMFMYVMVFTLLVTSLSLEFFNPRGALALVPFIAVSRLAVGEALPAMTYLGHLLLLAWTAGLFLWTADRLLERDDVALGIKPGLFTLFSLGAGALMRKSLRHPLRVSSALSLLSCFISLPLALLLEISMGLALLYLYGLGEGSMTLMLVLFAAVEEVVKPLPLYALRREMPGFLDEKKGLLLGALSGAGFSILETLFITLAVLFYMPSLVLQIITLRTGTTLLVHVLASGVVGLGVSRSKNRRDLLLPLILATALHVTFNLVVVRA
jgi:ABC-2 type transport system permease protein